MTCRVRVHCEIPFSDVPSKMSPFRASGVFWSLGISRWEPLSAGPCFAIERACYTMEKRAERQKWEKRGKTWEICPDRKWANFPCFSPFFPIFVVRPFFPLCSRPARLQPLLKSGNFCQGMQLATLNGVSIACGC